MISRHSSYAQDYDRHIHTATISCTIGCPQIHSTCRSQFALIREIRVKAPGHEITRRGEAAIQHLPSSEGRGMDGKGMKASGLVFDSLAEHSTACSRAGRAARLHADRPENLRQTE
jgi:hypothetical protein